MRSEARIIALGGMLAALAVVIMSMGGMIPVATYAVPMLCILLQQFVLKTCGRRIAWAWYGAVTVLGLLLCPDKEAAAVFAALGYYPIVKPKLDRRKLPWLWKGIFFNAVILILYQLLIRFFGMEQLAEDFAGIWTVLILLAMGNLVFFLLDILLGRQIRRMKR